jgi:hypothetical protein
MFLVRVRTFLEWHLRDGRDIHLLMPSDPNVAAHLAAMQLFEGLDVSADPAVQEAGTTAEAIIPLRTVTDHTGIEDVADAFVSVAERRDDVAGLADALHMAIGEFGDNAVSHGRNELGLRIAASAGGEDAQEVVLAIGDLGVGIPEHIRRTNPEWGDDTAAIGRALAPGVSGERDRHRGYGFLHVQEAALTARLSAARMEIYSANGFLRLEIVQGTFVPTPLHATTYRRGTWISYAVVSAG